MPTEPDFKPQGFQSQRQAGFEHKDASVSGLFRAVLLLAILAFLIHLSVSGLLHHWNKQPSPIDSWTSTPRLSNPPQTNRRYPPLQVSPPVDLEAFRARENAELTSYGWINRSSGAVRVPVDRAMDLLLQKGLPTRSGTNQTISGPSTLQLQQQRPDFRDPKTVTNQ